jgi:predicted N-acetyltransferase YhbS
MTSELIPEHMLTNRDEADIARLLARCFSTDFGGRSYFLTRHSWRHVVRRDDAIIAHLAVQLRAVRLGDDLLTIAGIAEVATDPNHRGEGHAASLLQAAIGVVRQSTAEFVLLFGTANLYPAAGFRPIANPMTYLDLTGARTGSLRVAKVKVHLQVLALTDRTWHDGKPLDLLGGLF